MRRDPVFAAGGGRPVGVEWRFGEAAGRLVTSSLPGGGRVRFAGRLDRVDATPRGARVIDYKTGAGATEESASRTGSACSCPCISSPCARPGDGGHRRRSRACTGSSPGAAASRTSPAGRRGRRERGSRDLVAGAPCELVDAGLFPRTTAGRCDYCDVGYACGVSAWARARKREHELLAGVVSLQGTAPAEVSDDADA